MSTSSPGSPRPWSLDRQTFTSWHTGDLAPELVLPVSVRVFSVTAPISAAFRAPQPPPRSRPPQCLGTLELARRKVCHRQVVREECTVGSSASQPGGAETRNHVRAVSGPSMGPKVPERMDTVKTKCEKQEVFYMSQ